MSKTNVSPYYIEGIKEGREALIKYGKGIAQDELDNLIRTLKGFDAASPVGQMLRGERDFWKNQVARTTGA